VSLLGSIDAKPALVNIERAALPAGAEELRSYYDSFVDVSNLGANDVYAWYLAKVNPVSKTAPDVKLNLIYPCTDGHIKKYSPQSVRMVTETSAIYAQSVRPYMERKRSGGRIDWVFNIIEGRTEQEDIILRSSRDFGNDVEGFLLLPDMNWDRKTIGSLRMLGLVERRDLWSLRDLKKRDVPWLKVMQGKVLEAVSATYQGVERDMLKIYLHCLSLLRAPESSLKSYTIVNSKLTII
jgi:m7GpppX diphosphatase